jgi:predicted peptidase
MRPLSLFPLVATMVCGVVMPKSARAAETQTVHAFERTITKAAGYKYLLALPRGYQPRGERRWPLMLFLHGSGERGDDVWSVAKHGPPKLLHGGATWEKEDAAARARRHAATTLLAENFIVVSPQCQKGVWWDTDALLALLDEIERTHPVDPARVYLTGLSMGGYGAWHLGTAFPERFAAMAPVCGGGTLATLFVSNTHKRSELRSLAVWAFHGAKDESVPLVESERMVEFLRRLKVEAVQLTVYPEARHDSWTETYSNPELYRWFLNHTRAPAGATTQ